MLLSSTLMAGCLANRSPAENSVVEVPADDPRPERADPFVEPNVQFAVTTTSGTCPETVGLWALAIGFEGGADHTVVVDTAAIAERPVQLHIKRTTEPFKYCRYGSDR